MFALLYIIKDKSNNKAAFVEEELDVVVFCKMNVETLENRIVKDLILSIKKKFKFPIAIYELIFHLDLNGNNSSMFSNITNKEANSC